MSRRRTLAPRGSRTVSVLANNTPGARTTAILGISLAGEKLRPLLVFKGAANGRIARNIATNVDELPEGIGYAVQKNAWTDEGIMLKYIEQVLTFILILISRLYYHILVHQVNNHF
jgi:hypothetical protein